MPLIHIIINVVLIILFFATGYFLSGKRKLTIILYVILLSLILVKGYILTYRPDIFTNLVAFSWAIFYFNFYPFAVAAFIPLAWKYAKGRSQKIRVVFLCGIFFLISLYPYHYFLLPLAQTRPMITDENGVVIQTSADTCSAAAATTLASLYDIETTEAEVVKLALTKKNRGTDRLGLYRALKILAERSDKDLNVHIEKISAKKLVEYNLPAIITVGIPAEPETPGEKKMVRVYNWDPGAVHDVCYMGNVGGTKPLRVRIGEPEFGLEIWEIGALEILHKGMAIFME